MTKVLDWIKANKLATVLLIVVLWFIAKSGFGVSLLGRSNYYSGDRMVQSEMDMAGEAKSLSMASSYMPPSPDVAPSDSADRLVIRNTSMSLQVADVNATIAKIENKATELGGFLVNSNLNQPEQAATGDITVRVPEESRLKAMEYFKSLSIKVVSESVSGQDVTDQYEDINASLATLNKTKAKFEEILNTATRIQDILEVQREIISLQSQIDGLKGRQQYLEKTARLSRITIYLGTDDLALPYAPEQAWRPQVVFKLAVRSLIGNLRELGSTLIWVAVYVPIWLPLLLIAWWFKRRSNKGVTAK